MRQNQDKKEFTYGEVLFESYLPLMKLTNPKEGEIFWDIGCGGAKPVAIAALAFPELKCNKGIEYLPQLAQEADDAMTRLKENVQSMN